MKELKTTDPAGTRGACGGRPAVRVDLDGRPYAIALRNEGAAGETDPGILYTSEEAFGKFAVNRPRAGEWHLPTEGEMRALARTHSTWKRKRGRHGRAFALAGGEELFLPAAGFMTGGTLFRIGHGEYWTDATEDRERTLTLRVQRRGISMGASYRGNLYSVRLFCKMEEAR